MAGVAILHLIACNYFFISDDDAAVPLNNCFSQFDPHLPYVSYKYVCDASSDTVLKLDYLNINCVGTAGRQQVQRHLAHNGCSNNNGIVCASSESVKIFIENTATFRRFERGYIVNRCATHSSAIRNSSKYLQCNGKNELMEWQFFDAFCTELQSVSTFFLGDDEIIQSINHCPHCSLSTVYVPVSHQPHLVANYIVMDGMVMPMDVCNQFMSTTNGHISSYEYSCDVYGQAMKSIWLTNADCNGLYDVYEEVVGSVDYNCYNFANMISKKLDIQPSYVQIRRYSNMNDNDTCNANVSEWNEIALIINDCIQINSAVWLIVEAHSSFWAMHYYKDSDCLHEVPECLQLIQNNSCSLQSGYIESIQSIFGQISTAPALAPADIATSSILDAGLSIDANNRYVEANYININFVREPMDTCNQFVEFGHKQSYKYSCTKNGNNVRFKKRRWRNKLRCDDDGDGDMFDEEEDVDKTANNVIAWSCDYNFIPIKTTKIHCYRDKNYFEERSVILNNCIQINHQQNSLYVECYAGYTLTHYYFS